MNMSNFKIGVGPMSADVVDSCLSYSRIYDYSIMIIASRNQADYDSGYAFTTQQLVSHIKSNSDYDSRRVLICRDHCGPYFSDLDKNLDLETAMSRCRNTIQADIAADFDIIHIDVSRIPPEHQERCSHELFKYALDLNPNILFEYGTEDNSIENLSAAVDAINTQLHIAAQYNENVKFIVSRTGSLVKHTQVGAFDAATSRLASTAIHQAGYLFKEHNADYLSRDEVKSRLHNGVDAVNIAPQLGSIQSEVIYNLSRENPLLAKFIDLVINAEYWRKWCSDDIMDTKTRFISAAHYSFGTQDYLNLRSTIDDNLFTSALKSSVHKMLDEYRLGYSV